tara:strand:- start:163 stop:510 length:348 start_codon:yes stop_codon:yes gene_type:complete
MAEPFTIRIFVPDGDPEGVHLIDRMNWTGLGVVFRRENWADTSKRAEFARTGVYFLAGHPEEDDERSTLYIGQADGLRTRIGQQLKAKIFGIGEWPLYPPTRGLTGPISPGSNMP